MITVRLHRREDIPYRVKWMNNPKVNKFIGDRLGSKTTLKEQTVWFSNYQKDKTKKFVWVETQWIDLWWKEASKDEKETLREIIKEKRFEFILGAWCMSDEATPTYSAIIDQVTLG